MDFSLTSDARREMRLRGLQWGEVSLSSCNFLINSGGSRMSMGKDIRLLTSWRDQNIFITDFLIYKILSLMKIVFVIFIRAVWIKLEWNTKTGPMYFAQKLTYFPHSLKAALGCWSSLFSNTVILTLVGKNNIVWYSSGSAASIAIKLQREKSLTNDFCFSKREFCGWGIVESFRSGSDNWRWWRWE